MRGVKNFAYDLDMLPGAVNSRVVLLLRSIEAKPRQLIFERNLPTDMPDAGYLEGGGHFCGLCRIDRRVGGLCGKGHFVKLRVLTFELPLAGGLGFRFAHVAYPWAKLLQGTATGHARWRNAPEIWVKGSPW